MVHTTLALIACSALLAHAADFQEVKHLTDSDFSSFAEATPKFLVMFYAPWCGHCKSMKPAYAEAAAQVGEVMPLVAVDCTDEGSTKTCKQYDVSGYPTLKFFENSVMTHDYKGGRSAVAFKNFAHKKVNPDYVEETDPDAAPEEPAEDWAPAGVVMTTDETLGELQLPGKKSLVFFYAPWCGHCKSAKPQIEKVPSKLLEGVAIAAIDCTAHTKACSKFEVTGYPTFKYLDGNSEAESYEGARSAKAIISFLNKKLDAEWVPPVTKFVNEDRWGEDSKRVVFLGDEHWDQYRLTHPHMLVMFYAPWCGHCKEAKPHFAKASDRFRKYSFVAVDCTDDGAMTCESFGIKGYPQLTYFTSSTDGGSTYTDARDEVAFINFVDMQERIAARKVDDSDLSEPRLKKMRVKQLRQLLADRGESCDNCNEKSELVAKVLSIADKPKVQKQKRMTWAEERRHKNATAMAEAGWADMAEGNGDIVHLTEWSFDKHLKENPNTLVMYYAPWCGHCTAAKPNYVKASKQAPAGSIAAVECDANSQLCKKQSVKSFPTFLFHADGESEAEPVQSQKWADFVNKKRDPNWAPPPPPQYKNSPMWGEGGSSGAVWFSDGSDWEGMKAQMWAKGVSAMLVMFYAPWCGHCKSLKPTFAEASTAVAHQNPQLAMVAVDCTGEEGTEACGKYGVSGYPTLKYETLGGDSFGEDTEVVDYDGGRGLEDFTKFAASKAEEKADKAAEEDEGKEEL